MPQLVVITGPTASGKTTLAIELASRASSESEEVAENIIADYDNDGVLVSLTLEHVSNMLPSSFVGRADAPAQPHKERRVS